MQIKQSSDSPHTLSNECVIVLTDEEQNTIRAITDTLSSWDIANLDVDDVFTRVNIAQKEISQNLASTLINFRRNSNKYGTLLIRNLPVDHTLPPTPNNGQKTFPKHL